VANSVEAASSINVFFMIRPHIGMGLK